LIRAGWRHRRWQWNRSWDRYDWWRSSNHGFHRPPRRLAGQRFRQL